VAPALRLPARYQRRSGYQPTVSGAGRSGASPRSEAPALRLPGRYQRRSGYQPAVSGAGRSAPARDQRR